MKNESLKDRWIKALRSGVYKQGRYSLRWEETDEFCCLGVLCDLENPTGWVKNSLRKEGVDLHNDYYCNYIQSSGPNSLFDDQFVLDLISMNDDKQADFSTIADYIEDNL